MNIMTYFASIYRFAAADCTNGGSSSRHASMIVVESTEAESYKREHEGEDLDDVLVLERRRLWGDDAWYLRPINEPKGKIGPMMGGNYAEVSRVSRYLLPIHDRYETQEEYDVLSR